MPYRVRWIGSILIYNMDASAYRAVYCFVGEVRARIQSWYGLLGPNTKCTARALQVSQIHVIDDLGEGKTGQCAPPDKSCGDGLGRRIRINDLRIGALFSLRNSPRQGYTLDTNCRRLDTNDFITIVRGSAGPSASKDRLEINLSLAYKAVRLYGPGPPNVDDFRTRYSDVTRGGHRGFVVTSDGRTIPTPIIPRL